MAAKLFLAPIKPEFSNLSHAFQKKWKHETLDVQSYTALYFPEPNIYLAIGGLGKVEMALKTQFWLRQLPDCKMMACVGSAGSLDESLHVADIIVASKTIEHDFKQVFFKKPPPEFKISDEWLQTLQLERFKNTLLKPIASGDEDVLSVERRAELFNLTGASAVAWEGAGAARACAFLKIPFCEIRAITDNSTTDLKQDFTKNYNHAMLNLADLLIQVCSH